MSFESILNKLVKLLEKQGDIIDWLSEYLAKPFEKERYEIKLSGGQKFFIFLMVAFFSIEVVIYFSRINLADSDDIKAMAGTIFLLMIIWCAACGIALITIMALTTPYLLMFLILLLSLRVSGRFVSGRLHEFVILILMASTFYLGARIWATWKKNLEARSYLVFFLSIFLFLLSLLVQGWHGQLWPLASRDLPLVIGGSNVSFTEIVGLPFALIGSYPALIGVPLSPAQSGAAQGVLFLFVAAIMLLVWARNLLSDSGGRVHPVVAFLAFYFFVSGLCAEIASHTVYARSFTFPVAGNDKDLNDVLSFFTALRRVFIVIALAATIFFASGAKNYLSAESIPWTSNILAQANSWAESRVWKLIPWVFGLVLAATLLTQFWPEGLPIYVQDVFGLALAWFLMKFIGLPREYRLMCSRHYTAKQMWDSSYKPPALVPDDDEVERNL